MIERDNEGDTLPEMAETVLANTLETTKQIQADFEATQSGVSHQPLLERIGNYRIVSRLGGGGMGVVYLAHDDALDRETAVKVIRPDMAVSETMMARLKIEAQAAARLTHPNIVSVYAFGVDRSLHYVAFEYVDGTDLAEIISLKGRLDAEDALKIIRQTAVALRFALANNVIHRDIKPANLLVLEDGTVKIADFGLAKVLDNESNLTRDTSVLGSPAFMSPEQATGSAVDFRSDIYSLGCTLYACITGHSPFTADSPMAVLMKHVSDPMPEPPELKNALGGRIIDLFHRMTSKAPDKRFASYDELIDAIDTVLLGKTARFPLQVDRGGGKRILKAAAAGGVVVLFGFFAVSMLKPDRRVAMGDNIPAVAPVEPANAKEEPAVETASTGSSGYKVPATEVGAAIVAGEWDTALRIVNREANNETLDPGNRRILQETTELIRRLKEFEASAIQNAQPWLPASIDLPNDRTLSLKAITSEAVEMSGPGGRTIETEWSGMSPLARGFILDRAAGELPDDATTEDVFTRCLYAMINQLPNGKARWREFHESLSDKSERQHYQQLWSVWTRLASAGWDSRGSSAGFGGRVSEAQRPAGRALRDRPDRRARDNGTGP